MTNRILRAYQKLKAMDEEKFTEYDLRGLSKAEKEFIRDNGYSKTYSVKSSLLSGSGKFYLFVHRNRCGRMQLYAQRKDMVVRPNGINACFPTRWNNEVWLQFNWRWPHFNMYDVEIHLAEIAPLKYPLL